MTFVYWRLNDCTETVYRSLVVDRQGGAREGLYVEKASIFQSSHTHLLGKTKNIPWLTLHAKKIDWRLSPKLQYNASMFIFK